jgi:hypothetical protein
MTLPAGDPVQFVRTKVCSLASLPVRSGGLQSTPHDIRPCAYAKASATRVRLANTSGYEPAHKVLTPSGAPARWSASPVERQPGGIIWYLRDQMPMLGTHTVYSA